MKQEIMEWSAGPHANHLHLAANRQLCHYLM